MQIRTEDTCMVNGLGFGVEDFGFRVKVSCLELKVQCLGFWGGVEGLGLI